MFNGRLDAWQQVFSENGRQISRKYSSGCMMYREQKDENTKKKEKEKSSRDIYNMCYPTSCVIVLAEEKE